MKITKDEFYREYGHVMVGFSNYYKYVFTYGTILPGGKSLLCEFGGSPGYIYNHILFAKEQISINDLQPYSASIIKDGEAIETYTNEDE